MKGTAFDYSDRPFVRDAELNAERVQARLRHAPARSSRGCRAHSAPLGLAFTRTELPGIGSGALVGVHGSWNRNPPARARGRVLQLRQRRDGRAAARSWAASRTAAAAAGAGRWPRSRAPTATVYVSDDYANAVYRLTPPA